MGQGSCVEHPVIDHDPRMCEDCATRYGCVLAPETERTAYWQAILDRSRTRNPSWAEGIPTSPPDRCAHGYHATEGECPTCDVDRDGFLPSGARVVTVTVSEPYTLIAGSWDGMRPVGRRRTYVATVDGVRIEQTSKDQIQRIIRRKVQDSARARIVFVAETDVADLAEHRMHTSTPGASCAPSCPHHVPAPAVDPTVRARVGSRQTRLALGE